MKSYLTTACFWRDHRCDCHFYRRLDSVQSPDENGQVVSPRLPVRDGNRKWRLFGNRGRNSMVECQLPKLKVASSILVARSIFFKAKCAY